MATIMTAMTSDLYNHGRSDPEYYLPNHIAVEADLLAVPTVSLRKLGHLCCSAFYPAATHLYNDAGRPFLRCVDIVDYPIISNEQPFAKIPAEFADAYSTIRHLKAGDIVISKVGSPCFASLLSADMEDAAMTRTVLGMSSINTELVDPHYLIAFLRSRFGFDQLMRERELTIQYQLTLDRTRKVKVFTPPIAVQNQVGDIVRKYYQCLSESKNAYTHAQQLIESELGLDKLRFDKPVGYTARFSIVGLADGINANRIDAQCFSPEAVFYEDWLLKHANCDRLSLLIAGTAKGRQQAETETGTTDYCSIKHIAGREIVGVSKAYPSAGTPNARKDDLLLAITGATIGKIGIVNRYDNLVFSGDMLRLRGNASISPHYLLLTLDHHIGQVQFNRWITGSTNGHLAPRDVGRILVPRLTPETEENIAALVAESLEKRQVSEQLLDQAKSRVELLIEEAVRT